MVLRSGSVTSSFTRCATGGASDAKAACSSTSTTFAARLTRGMVGRLRRRPLGDLREPRLLASTIGGDGLRPGSRRPEPGAAADLPRRDGRAAIQDWQRRHWCCLDRSKDGPDVCAASRSMPRHTVSAESMMNSATSSVADLATTNTFQQPADAGNLVGRSETEAVGFVGHDSPGIENRARTPSTTTRSRSMHLVAALRWSASTRRPRSRRGRHRRRATGAAACPAWVAARQRPRASDNQSYPAFKTVRTPGLSGNTVSYMNSVFSQFYMKT